ncbi:MAG: beta-lactamase family protein [Alphaproteobacteria bacterium]|nr:beta-lactamase family protein [Alphaproteobacteria bacterium]MBU0865669.1 beta-lactamase family protein [Alphaproteobacteria bacterium]MBU1825563.1 beta-lactamase family protein [Alphaproteobacteria bacterium]
MTIRLTVQLVGACALLASAAPAGAESVADPATISQRLLDTLRETNGVPGMGAAVWQDGEILWEGSSGLRDIKGGAPVTRDTLFRLASVSKLFTVTAAAKLAEEGTLDLDAPVQAQLPWLGARWPAITPRQLAAHVSGLPHYQDVDTDRGAVHYRTGREAVAIFANRDLLSPPGTAYSYSSWGYTLLGTLVEEHAGQPFPDYVTRQLVPGLAVRADATHSGDTNASRAYGFEAGRIVEMPRHDFSYTWGGGGLSGTAGAVATFGGQMIDAKIVRPATFDAMLVPVRLANGRPAGEPDYDVGFGWRISRDPDGAPFVHHNGSAIGARSTVGLWRAERTAVSVLANASWVSRMEPTAQMIAAPFRPAPAGLTGATCPIDTQRYSGMFGDAAVEGTVRFRIDRGLCVGTAEQHPAMRGYFGTAMQRNDAPLMLIGLDPKGGFARAGLVNPFGIADLRAQADGSFSAEIATGRRLVLRFDQPGK